MIHFQTTIEEAFSKETTNCSIDIIINKDQLHKLVTTITISFEVLDGKIFTTDYQTCLLCNYKYTTADDLNNHILFHKHTNFDCKVYDFLNFLKKHGKSNASTTTNEETRNLPELVGNGNEFGKINETGRSNVNGTETKTYAEVINSAEIIFLDLLETDTGAKPSNCVLNLVPLSIKNNINQHESKENNHKVYDLEREVESSTPDLQEFNGDKLLFCNKCDFGSSNQIDLSNHVKLFHELRESDDLNVDPLNCEENALIFNLGNRSEVIEVALQNDCEEISNSKTCYEDNNLNVDIDLLKEKFVRVERNVPTECEQKTQQNNKREIYNYEASRESCLRSIRKLIHIPNKTPLKTLKATVPKKHDKKNVFCNKCDFGSSNQIDLINHTELLHAPYDLNFDSLAYEESGLIFTEVNKAVGSKVIDKLTEELVESDLEESGNSKTGLNDDLNVCVDLREKQFAQGKNNSAILKDINEYIRSINSEDNKICNFEARTKLALEVHGRIHHTDKKPLTSEKCDFKTSYKTSLRNYRKRMHDGSVLLRCSLCDFQTDNKVTLTCHLQTHDGKVKNLRFKCNICGLILSQKASLEAHIRVHTGEKPFHCLKCDYKSASRSGLINHKKTHRENKDKPYLCDK